MGVYGVDWISGFRKFHAIQHTSESLLTSLSAAYRAYARQLTLEFWHMT